MMTTWARPDRSWREPLAATAIESFEPNKQA
jgi:hypothetical protein